MSVQPEYITFRPLNEDDFVLLHGWLNQPHMRQFYQDTPVSLSDVVNKFLPRARLETPTRDHIAQYREKPIGKLQCYKIIDYPETAKELELTSGIGIDLFIGEPEFVGKGIGSLMLKSYVHKIAFPLFQQEDSCYICHDLTNTIARSCSRKAGFYPVREVIEEGKSCELLMLTR